MKESLFKTAIKNVIGESESHVEGSEDSLDGKSLHESSKVDIDNSLVETFKKNMDRLNSVSHNEGIEVDVSFRGFRNENTWGVVKSLIENKSLRNRLGLFLESYSGIQPYRDFIQSVGLQNESSVFGYKWMSSDIDLHQINKIVEDLKNE
jgi:hypothetical protein